jgi:hypothetical protein
MVGAVASRLSWGYSPRRSREHARMPQDIPTHLIQLEQSLHSPTIRANPEAVSALLAEDFREFGASGRIWTRNEILALLAAESPYEITSHDFACQLLTPELALLTYITETPQRRVLRSSLWRLEDTTWRMVFHQGTPIP